MQHSDITIFPIIYSEKLKQVENIVNYSIKTLEGLIYSLKVLKFQYWSAFCRKFQEFFSVAIFCHLKLKLTLIKICKKKGMSGFFLFYVIDECADIFSIWAEKNACESDP